MNLFKKTLSTLKITKEKIKNVFSNVNFKKPLTTEDINKIEECLLTADVSWELTEFIIKEIKNNRNKEIIWEKILINSIKKTIPNFNLKNNQFKKVIIVIGINGSGKTTTAAKLANYLKVKSKSVSLVAADTFRAGAINQLKIWSERLNVSFISNANSNDPASIAYDGTISGIKKNIDYIIVDTAGRLHTSVNLMKELEKLYRIVNKITDQITVIITLDANIGQNGIKQVEEFNKFLPIDSIILNKMDGTAKGGVALSIMNKLSIPISFLGIGESFEDIIPFDINNYLNSLVKD